MSSPRSIISPHHFFFLFYLSPNILRLPNISFPSLNAIRETFHKFALHSIRTRRRTRYNPPILTHAIPSTLILQLRPLPLFLLINNNKHHLRTPLNIPHPLLLLFRLRIPPRISRSST